MNPLDQLADIAVSSILMDRPMQAGLNKINLDQAKDIQDLVGQKLSSPWGGLAGYKIAWNTDAQMKAFDIPHPGMGRVFHKFVREDGAQIALADFNELMIETEIVAYLGKDLGPGHEYTAADMHLAVEGFSVGFEVLDRLEGASEASPHSIIAHNIFNAGAVVGGLKLPSAELDVSKMTTRLMHDGTIVFEDTGKAPQDPFEAVAFIANHFTSRGHNLKAGELILCGSHIPLYPVATAGEFSVSMSGLGGVSFSVI